MSQNKIYPFKHSLFNTRVLTIIWSLLMFSFTTQGDAKLPDLAKFKDLEKKYNSVLTAPVFEDDPDEIAKAIDQAIKKANADGDKLAQLKDTELSFKNTFVALDSLLHEIDGVVSRHYLIKETTANKDLKKSATDSVKKYQDWIVDFQYREDVYKVLKKFAATDLKLNSVDKKLLNETLRDYKRAGLDLPKKDRDELIVMQKQLAKLETDFDNNINKVAAELTFTKEDLKGLPESFLNNKDIKNAEGKYNVKVNITWHYLTIMENAELEATRKKLFLTRYKLAKEKNIPVLTKIVKLRAKIAHQLGYNSWADYKTEVKMAQNEKTVSQFLNNLYSGLQPKFEEEISRFTAIKSKKTGIKNTAFNIWDWRYYRNQLMKEKYNVDNEALRVYFPYQKVLDGMFNVFETIFSLSIEQISNPDKWHSDVTLYAISDKTTNEPLGLFYLDMFPREGKYNHFAQFGIISGKKLESGKYQRPTVALLCNFPPPDDEGKSLLKYNDVETLFHEFGHVLHSILTRSPYSRFSGTSVPRDFVEAPSQLLEYWLESKQILDIFAADYRNPDKKFPQKTLDQIIASKKATVGSFYRRQLAYGMLDIELHKIKEGEAVKNIAELANNIINKIFLPVPDDTAFVAYFGHLTGYDAGYYGYAWADAISADMATIFENSSNGYLDLKAGMRLRKEIYEQGNMRDINDSVQLFLGRKTDINPFLNRLGIK